MSRASAWAKKLCDTRTMVTQVLDQRPGTPESVQFDKVKLEFGIADNGMPVLVMRDANEFGIGGQVHPEHLQRLLNAAEWLIETFGETKKEEA